MFHPVNSLVVIRFYWRIYQVNFDFFFQIQSSKHTKNSKDFKSVLVFILVLVVVDLLLNSGLFMKQKLLNISGTHSGAWRQKLAADLSKAHRPIFKNQNNVTLKIDCCLKFFFAAFKEHVLIHKRKHFCCKSTLVAI